MTSETTTIQNTEKTYNTISNPEIIKFKNHINKIYSCIGHQGTSRLHIYVHTTTHKSGRCTLEICEEIW